MDERYIVIVGQSNKGEIYVLDLRDRTIKQSGLKGPTEVNMNAIMVDNKRQKYVITYGYTRNVWNEYKMGTESRFPPEYLL